MSTETTDGFTCDVCGRAFDNAKSKAAHMGHGHNEPWMDESTLQTEYVDKGRTSTELADDWGCDPTTVRNWLNRFNIDIREAAHYNRVEYADYNQHDQGYERWQNYYGEDRGVTVFVHRLLAVAKYGFDAVANNHVHHKKSIPWLNTYENIELMSKSEHAKQHYENGDLELEPGGIDKLQGSMEAQE